jgi:hypothetical protein
MTDHAHTDPMTAMYAKLGQAIASVGTVAKTAEVKTGKYDYKHATLNDVLDVVQEALTAQGLTLAMPLNTRDELVFVDILIIEIATGNYLHFPGLGTPVNRDPQANGSAITYAKRYALVSMFSLHVEDDDGQQAGRSVRDPQNRTAAESQIRQGLATLTREERAEFAEDFKTEFNCTLTQMAESRHGEALGFWKFWKDDKWADPELRLKTDEPVEVEQ